MIKKQNETKHKNGGGGEFLEVMDKFMALIIMILLHILTSRYTKLYTLNIYSFLDVGLTSMKQIKEL